ncbi:hypothetical protein SAMN05444162_3633 [Paenibacillaceae bacterium GAS479]|nr:hypothetical protein SAMN05444162_3633 [Paenibacillaceae bacterium GAS479]
MKDGPVKLVAALVLGVSFIAGVLLYNPSTEKIALSNSPPGSAELQLQKIMNVDEAASYLRIPVSALMDTIKKDDATKKIKSPSHAFQYIPYMLIQGQPIFYRTYLDQWVEFNSSQ